MKHVGVREFRDRATGYFKETEPIAVERHGKLIGFYIPVEPKRDARGDAELRAAVERLDASVKKALDESGMTEDELAEHLDLSRKEGTRRG